MKTRKTFLSLTALALIVAAPASHAFLDKLLPTKTDTKDGDAKMDLPEYKGLKHAIGVVNFENEAGWRGRWELGSNLGIMLESALMDSGRFVVVDRENLRSTLAEQDLQSSGRAAKADDVAQTGAVRSAKYLASGAITTVDENTSGSGGGISIRGISLGAKGSKATITAIIKLVDSTTSEIVAKKRIEGKAGSKGLKIGYRGSDFGGNLGGFNKTPLGEAAQDVINQAVEFLALQMEETGFEGTVIKTSSSGQVIINRGTQYGVEEGQVFVVRTEGEKLIDPDTGEVLDEEEGEVICKIKVTKVREKLAYCELVDGDAPERGATVVAE